MLNFLLGALAMLALVTFAPPAIASMPSVWLRAAVAWLRGLVRQGPEE